MAFIDPGQIFGISLVLVVILVSTWIFFRGNIARCHSKTDLTGKTAIVTGSNCGIGFYTALDLAKRNAKVILACRNKEKAEKAKQEIISQSSNPNVSIGIVDLSSMRSVRNFVEQIKREESRLDILINNAGLTSHGKGKEVSEEGLETIFAANYFGPFLLTNLLLDLMKASAPARIVNVSSVIHKFGSIDFDNLQAEKSFKYHARYCDSKLANILFTRELARRLEGTGVTANVLHPGTVATELLRNQVFFVRTVGRAFVGTFCKTGDEGAQTSICLAVSEDVKDINGKYFTECAVDEDGASALSKDMDLARKLWNVSAQLTGLDS